MYLIVAFSKFLDLKNDVDLKGRIVSLQKEAAIFEDKLDFTKEKGTKIVVIKIAKNLSG
ncbi:hypothetical protein GOY07_01800 [Wolbachia endosymbiont of Litomosoides sigmodontis]|uniref:hypothetical protein n=1 Tax=Wolbachia endosymbiont of Litomosoides sigmodontis TaxID=80850 RepID=UPI00158CF871|nr:hypothetical protein [Wolbachia endosymbiont of Litomosoides sigmodontis]QKX02937.1 hypothetical protein GOY07_01800 [Wolbachia endosymbiont of Litomosoides sigmodontis]